MKTLKAIFGCFFVILGMFSMLGGGLIAPQPVDAVENTEVVAESETQNTDDSTAVDASSEQSGASTDNSNNDAIKPVSGGAEEKNSKDNCKSSLGAIGWLVCPTTGKIAEAVDWLYDRIESLLVIEPISVEDGTPIYEIWKFCRGITNIVFIIFLLVVIYSQLTGIGISNYGIKKVLPKLIIAAVLINFSFLICSLAVEVSNIIGNGLRGLFTSIQETVSISQGDVSYGGLFSLLVGGGAALGVLTFNPADIWLLIPVVLGAIVAVVTGLITIALRQAVIALLIMVSPLAFVSYILPNVDSWFKKWKDLFWKMLEFYPLFSLLFGASALAGFAIVASAKSGFGVILGVAVQVFPLIFCWKLMTMSGTILGTINTKMRGIMDAPLARNRNWASMKAADAKQRQILNDRARLPSVRLMQFMSNKQIAKEEDRNIRAALIKHRGLAYRANSHYKKDGSPTKAGERVYADIIKDLEYQKDIARDEHTMNAGLGAIAVGQKQKMRLDALDDKIIVASDSLKMEMARGAKIDYENTAGYYNRVKMANYAHTDDEALRAGDDQHQMHAGALDRDGNNLARYESMRRTMDGKVEDIGYILADAAHNYESQSQIVKGKFRSHFDNIEATQDVVNELNVLTKNASANKYIDPIIAGVRTLNTRGDTDLAWTQIDNVLRSGSVQIGSHAMQSIANYCMFDVGSNDPAMRRFGKYINLETAKMFNADDPANRRTRRDISLYEFINGEYIDRDEEGHVIYNDDGQPVIRKTKKPAQVLLKGTSYKDMERTAIATMENMIRAGSVDLTLDENGNEVATFNYEKFKKNEEDIWDAILPNVIGDHFSFLSGSEQILAMGKGITGISVKDHGFDWEGIFGKDIARQLTPEQKRDYIKTLNKRTKKFLGGQVPSQIARTKSDMLESVRNQYALQEALNSGDPRLAERILRGDKISNDEYKDIERRHLDAVKREFVGSFKEDALKGFVKMHHKGYQGEAKDGLIQLLDPDELYRQYFPYGENNRRRRNDIDDDDDDDGAPIGFDNGTMGTDGPVFNSTRASVDAIYDSYRGINRLNVTEFWEEIKTAISESDEIMASEAFIEYIEGRLSQYTDAAALYADIINLLFGGFGD